MKTEDYIKRFIEKEKQIEPTPFLRTRIMGVIEKPMVKKASSWQPVIATVSISLIMLLGFQLSNLYNSSSAKQTLLNINDSNIEMLHYYHIESNE
ncbi:MAG: hypothetical protein PHQ11_05960 [Paludibacter sp.]|nr:hypothetical protein [Paludibacter sp.]MDD4199611.1 hypothetical protein [Paludibacter sp.]MDD4428521.1 hypothetical protein [Paludibacter sp.]